MGVYRRSQRGDRGKALYKSLTGSEDAYKKSVAGVGSPGTAFPACLKERVGFGTRQARVRNESSKTKRS
jgi:hypothetical protein